MKKWFTLVEILIVTVIVGMLSTLVMQTYITMTRIAFRVQQEKQVTEQTIVLTQIVQNFADSMTIDYERYADTFGVDYITNNQWLVPILYLSWADGNIALYSSWDCAPMVSYTTGSGCWAVLEKNTDPAVALTQTGRASMTALTFKLIPYASQEQYLQDPSLCTTSFGACLYHPWFWMFTQMYTPYIQDTRESNIRIPIQAFFTLVQ